VTITQEQVDEAVDLLLRHVHGARSRGFIGDNRERSADIRRSVHRLDDPELQRRYQISHALARSVPDTMIPRDKRADLYDVSHELRAEYWDRVKARIKASEKGK
jgi:hypothetical protein